MKNFKFFSTVLLATVFFSFGACKGDEDVDMPTAYYDMGTMQLSFEAASYPLDFISDYSWSAEIKNGSTNSNWVSLSKTNGVKGENSITIFTDENNGKERRATLIITMKNEVWQYEIIQMACHIINNEKPGGFEALIKSLGMTEAYHLKLTGNYIGEDIRYLRYMMGRTANSTSTGGQLNSIDMSDMNILEGGGYYISNHEYDYAFSDGSGWSRSGTLYVQTRNTHDNVIGDYMFMGCNISSITLPANITRIGDWAFFNTKGWYGMNIDIPSTVTSIGSSAFDMSNIESIDIPSSVTSIGRDAFAYCNKLKDVKLSENLKTIPGGCFEKCDKIERLTIPNSVETIGSYAFSKCGSLKDVNLPKNLKTIGSGAFSDCRQLTSITIPNSVTSIESSAFSGCSSLTSITIPNSVTSIERSVFSYCAGLTSITIPNNVTSIGDGAFMSCKQLTKVIIPINVKTIGRAAFWNCIGLTEIYVKGNIPPEVTHSVSDDSSTFEGVVKSLCTIYVPKGSKSAYQSANGWKDFTNIIEE